MALENNLKPRVKAFALRIVRLVDSIPKNMSAQVIAKQVMRSGTSAAANYRSACRARSQADFVSKIGIAEEEADETVFWLEMLSDSGIVKKELLIELIKEAEELTAIFTSSGKTAKNNLKKK